MSQHRLIPVGELAKSEIRLIDIDGRSLLLVNGESGPALVDRICPHAGGRSCQRKCCWEQDSMSHT